MAFLARERPRPDTAVSAQSPAAPAAGPRTYATCAGAVLLGVLAAPDMAEVRWSELPSGVWLNIVCLAIEAAAIANLLYYREVGTVGPANASLMMFTVPVVNTLCATLLLGESFGRMQGAGAAVLLAGAALAAQSSSR
ncbi:EamA family transporter [Streptomyces sp. NPDC059262]|uniref:EamA family transporter n=1 Tax=Streptomyces sp. NPDC059262 TaxID=3346797 RepID=UPI00368D2284